jgi:hypothetical protein
LYGGDVTTTSTLAAFKSGSTARQSPQ